MFETSYTCRNMYQLYKWDRNTEYFALLARTLRVNSLCSVTIRSSLEAALTHSYWQWSSSKSKLKASAVSSGSWIKFNFFATRMSEYQSDCFFSTLEYATVPVRANKFAEVETGLNGAMICINDSNFFLRIFKKLAVQHERNVRSLAGQFLILDGLWPLGSAVILSSVTAWCGRNNKQSVCVISNKYVK